MKDCEHGVGCLGKIKLHSDEHYLAGKLLQEDHLKKVLHGIGECYQHNAGALRFRVPQLEWTYYRRLWPHRQLRSLCGNETCHSVRGTVLFTRALPHPCMVIICNQNKARFITKNYLFPICGIPHCSGLEPL